MSNKLVILDRDGVINADSDEYIKAPDEWAALPGSLEAIALLHQAGYRVVVATNQSGIGRGLFDMQTLNAIHSKMYQAVAQLGGQIDAIFFCPHTDNDHCKCRKPKAGMLHTIIERFEIDPAATPIVGDARRDLEAGATAGLQLHLVLTGKGQRTLAASQLPAGVQVHKNLWNFALDFLAQ